MSVEHSFCDDYRLPYEPFPVAEKSAKFVGCTYDNRRESRAREFKFESIIDLGSFYRLFLRTAKSLMTLTNMEKVFILVRGARRMCRLNFISTFSLFSFFYEINYFCSFFNRCYAD